MEPSPSLGTHQANLILHRRNRVTVSSLQGESLDCTDPLHPGEVAGAVSLHQKLGQAIKDCELMCSPEEV